ncbi:MAG: hypothetical protein PHD33_04695, partial [Atribacterota bacterium]|nr:hypothetical protein [Atribacterota bacterium]
MNESFHFYDRQVVIKSSNGICKDCEELLKSQLFKKVLEKYFKYLKKKNSPLLVLFYEIQETEWEKIVLDSFVLLSADKGIKEISRENSQFYIFLKDTYLFHQFVERLYDFWRHYERFFVKYDLKDQSGLKSFQKPYRAFNETIEELNHLVRKTYRNICENITGDHPRIYRQVPAGCQVGFITTNIEYQLPLEYRVVVQDIPLITQILIEPPLIVDPLM